MTHSRDKSPNIKMTGLHSQKKVIPPMNFSDNLLDAIHREYPGEYSYPGKGKPSIHVNVTKLQREKFPFVIFLRKVDEGHPLFGNQFSPTVSLPVYFIRRFGDSFVSTSPLPFWKEHQESLCHYLGKEYAGGVEKFLQHLPELSGGSSDQDAKKKVADVIANITTSTMVEGPTNINFNQPLPLTGDSMATPVTNGQPSRPYYYGKEGARVFFLRGRNTKRQQTLRLVKVDQGHDLSSLLEVHPGGIEILILWLKCVFPPARVEGNLRGIENARTHLWLWTESICNEIGYKQEKKLKHRPE